MGASIPRVRGVDIKSLVLFQLNGSYGLIAELADEASDEEWRSRANPGANLIGFTVWHCARVMDWAINCALRGKPEFVELPEWSDVGVPGALFGAGIPREIADLVPFRVSRDRVTAYINAMREAANEWLTAARLEDLEGVTDLKARRFSRPEYMEPETWSELERLHGIPRWQFLVRPTVSHIRIHYGEVSGQLESMRSGAAAAG